MKPEAALVTALAAGDAEALRTAVRARPDWGKAGELALSHQVDALCWWMWRQIVDEEGASAHLELPAQFRDLLRKGYLHQLLRNEALLDDLAALRGALLAHGVEGLFLKGPWMAFEAYPDPGTRPVGDVDLCVREQHYRPAVAALQAAGWTPDAPLPSSAAAALERSHYRRQLVFSAPGRRDVELHFRLVNVGPPAAEPWVWESSRELQAGTGRLRVPGPEAMLLHLLLHANQHGFAVLRMLHDVRWALERDAAELDQEMLLDRVRELRCRASCYHAFQLAAELADAPVDPKILDELRPSLARRALFARLWRLPAVRRLEARRRRVATESPLFYLLEMGRPWEKAGFAARVTARAGASGRLLTEARRIFSIFRRDSS